MAHVLVVGASNGIGLETVKAALAAGHRVRAFARSAAKIALSDANLERFTGDAFNESSAGGTAWLGNPQAVGLPAMAACNAAHDDEMS